MAPESVDTPSIGKRATRLQNNISLVRAPRGMVRWKELAYCDNFLIVRPRSDNCFTALRKLLSYRNPFDPVGLRNDVPDGVHILKEPQRYGAKLIQGSAIPAGVIEKLKCQEIHHISPMLFRLKTKLTSCKESPSSAIDSSERSLTSSQGGL